MNKMIQWVLAAILTLCGIAGFTDDEISPLFEKAHDLENIVLPPGW